MARLCQDFSILVAKHDTERIALYFKGAVFAFISDATTIANRMPLFCKGAIGCTCQLTQKLGSKHRVASIFILRLYRCGEHRQANAPGRDEAEL